MASSFVLFVSLFISHDFSPQLKQALQFFSSSNTKPLHIEVKYLQEAKEAPNHKYMLI
jgi:hypothetical protein